MAEPVRTIDDFLRVLRRSDLLEEPQIDALAAAWPDHAADLPEALVQRLVEAGLVTPWQVERLRAGHASFMLGKHRILGLLGRGGMSSVFLAEHTSLHTKRAIKVLPSDRIDQSSYLERFKREARAAANLQHPNIVQAFDLELEGKTKFIAMEYVDGIDLHAKVKRDGPLPLPEAIEYVKQAALGLQYAHQEGFIHRDVKPANLMLDRRGVVKILDLGLAFAGSTDEDSLTRAHDEKVLGTADYLAPEQAKDSHLADARSDIYALGCTLYYLLVGRPPFGKGTLAERIKAHLDGPRPNLLADAPGVPPAIADLFARMLDRHPDARPQTAKEIAEALDAWLKSAGQATSQQRRGLPERAKPGDSGIRAAAPARGPGGDMLLPLRKQAAPRLASPVATLPAGRGRPGPGSRFGKPPAIRSGAPADNPEVPPRAKPRGFLGMPLGFWLIGLGLLVVAGVLGYLVYDRFGAKKGRKPAVSAAQADGATAEDAAPAEPQPPAADATETDAESPPAAEPTAEKKGPPKAPAGKPGAKPAPAKADAKPRPGPLDDIGQTPKPAADGQPAAGKPAAPAAGEPAAPAAPANP